MIAGGLSLIIYLPILAILWRLTGLGVSGVNFEGASSALIFTLAQAVVSATAACTLGLMAAPGFARLRRTRALVRWVLLLPNFISAILIVLCLMIAWPQYPLGFWGVVLAHVFLNGGLATVVLGERVRKIESEYRGVARTLGASDGLFNTKVLWPQILPAVLGTWAMIFSLCLMSFAIPLVLGGGRATLEVLLFQKIHIDADVGSALSIALLQGGLQALVFFALKRVRENTLSSRRIVKPRGEMQRSWISALVLGSICIGTLYVFADLLRLGLGRPHPAWLWAITWGPALLSVSTAVVVGFLCVFFSICLVAQGWPSFWVRLPIFGGVITGLGWFVVAQGPPKPFYSLALFSGLFLTVFYFFVPQLMELRVSFEKPLATLGASTRLKMMRVYGPMGLRLWIGIFALSFCWALGDVSVAALALPSGATLPLLIQNLLGSYRLEEAAGIACVLLVLGGLTLAIVEGAAYGHSD